MSTALSEASCGCLGRKSEVINLKSRYVSLPTAFGRNVYSHTYVQGLCAPPHTRAGGVQDPNNAQTLSLRNCCTLPAMVKRHRVYLRSGQAIVLKTVPVFSAVFKTPSSCSLCFAV